MATVTNTARLPRKTKPKGRHPVKALSAAFLCSAPPGRHADGNGLFLFVQPSGTRSWIQRLVVRGRRRELGLGSVALGSLAEAREKALVNRKLARQGGDPLAEKRRTQGIPTFAEAAARVLEQKRAGWRNPRHPREWMSSLRRIDNPCDRIGPVLGPQHDVVEHMQALPHGDVAAVIRTVRESTASPAVRLAFEFLVLTAARWAEWAEVDRDEVDQDEGVWTVPAKRTKANRRHRVPLCGCALEILDAVRTLGEGAGLLVFTRRRGDGSSPDPGSREFLRYLIKYCK